MRTLGLLGGTTYHATIEYYKHINDHVQNELGDDHSASLVMHSFDFAELSSRSRAGKFEEVVDLLSKAAQNLKSIGAEAIVLCVNTLHQYADQVEKAAGLPLLHIIDYSGQAVQRQGLDTVALLGTQATMEGDFIKGRLETKHGLKVLVPELDTRVAMDGIIFKDLTRLLITDQTRTLYLNTARDLVRQGAQGIILACTELQFVLMPEDVTVPLFDTVELHAKGAAAWSLGEDSPKSD